MPRAEGTGDDSETQRIIILTGTIGRAIGVDKNGAQILAVGGHDNFPTHIGRDVHLIGNRALADGRVAGVDDDVGVHFALPGVGSEIHKVDSEV